MNQATRALPAVISPNGEPVEVVTAGHLLYAGGIEDVRLASVEALAEFADNTVHLTSVAREAQTVVGDELIRRMDRLGKWTVHEGEFTIKSSSPAAGTDKYDDERLAAALALLVEADLIDQDAATAAIEWVQPPAPAPYWKQKAAGIKALLKLGGKVTEAVLSATVLVDPPRRSAKVTRRAP